jgi:hypothetical protein
MPRQSPSCTTKGKQSLLDLSAVLPKVTTCRSCRAVARDGIPERLARCRPIILSIAGLVAKGLGGVRLGRAGRLDGGHLHRVGLPVHIASSPMRPTRPLGLSLP